MRGFLRYVGYRIVGVLILFAIGAIWFRIFS